MREENYYRTGAFIVDAFSQQNSALTHVPEEFTQLQIGEAGANYVLVDLRQLRM